MKPQIKVVERENHSQITITMESGEHYNIEVTENGLQITGIFDDTDMVIKPRTGNQILIANVPKIYL